MTKPEWIERWEDRLVGMALSGLVLDTDERVRGPNAAGGRAMQLPEKVRTLLAQMFESAQPDLPLATPKPPATATAG